MSHKSGCFNVLVPSRWRKRTRSQSSEAEAASCASTFKVNRPSAAIQSAKSKKRLRDINDDCLAKIFRYLNRDDLLNIVLYDKHFAVAAKKAFLQKYRDEYIVLSNITSRSFYPMYDLSEMNRSIQLLDCFGGVITNLCIRFKLENIGLLIDAVIRNCGDNIRKLKLDHASQERQKRLPHEHGTLSVNKLLKSANKNFPNLRELSLIYGSATDSCPYWYDVDEMLIPSLTHFTIDGRFLFEPFKTFIGLNRSIENLCVNSQYSDFKWNIEYDFVPLLDNALPQLRYLEMSVTCHVPDQPFAQCYPIYLQHLKTFKSVGRAENVWRPNFYQFAGTELQELELNELNCMQERFIDSILHFKQLKQITLEPEGLSFRSWESKTQLEHNVNEALQNEERIKVIIRMDPMNLQPFQRNLLVRPWCDNRRYNLLNFERF